MTPEQKVEANVKNWFAKEDLTRFITYNENINGYVFKVDIEQHFCKDLFLDMTEALNKK